MRVQLLRRWGVHKPGATVLVDDRQGEWLVVRGFGVEAPVTAFAPASVRAAKSADAGAGAASTAGAEVKPRARRAPTRRARKAAASTEGGSGDEQ